MKTAAGLALVGGGGFASTFRSGPRWRTELEFPTAGSGATDPVRSFRGRPDLRPPAVEVTGGRAAPGYLLLGPSAATTRNGSQPGPLLVDHRGQPVAFRALPSDSYAANLRVQSFQGEPVLTWWEGTVQGGYGQGEAVIVDSSYRELARVRAANGRRMDLHEFLITPEGTALFTCSPQAVQGDLSALGGSANAQVYPSVLQEIDIRTGRLLFEWRSLDHVPASESYYTMSEPFDYMHTNSITITPDGNLLVSGRHACAIYKLDRRTGQVIWRLGGKRSDFAMEKNARFFWQHDATQLRDGTISMFDNGSNGTVNTYRQSRAILLSVSELRRTARLARSYTHPQRLLATAMGNLQVLPNGNVLVGWGTARYATEFTFDGRIVSDARLPNGLNFYRGYRMPWTGAPASLPSVAANIDASGSRTVYASWNGATRIASWRVYAGASPDALKPAGIARRQGFETAISLGRASGYVALTALDPNWRPLGTSPTIRL